MLIISLASAVQVKPQEPLFVAVPPRPQRVLHSEAYIKLVLHSFITIIELCDCEIILMLKINYLYI